MRLCEGCSPENIRMIGIKMVKHSDLNKKNLIYN